MKRVKLSGASTVLCTLFLPVFLLLAGCASVVDDGQPFDKVITRDTDLYRTSEADSVTERHLEAGVRVKINGMSGDGKLEVETVSGEKGYVDADTVGDPPDPNFRSANTY